MRSRCRWYIRTVWRAVSAGTSGTAAGPAARLGSVPNVQSTFYRGGHMTYLDDASRALEKADLVRFYQRAALSP